jgi:hypothetical protein
MALAPADFYAYSRATGVPVPEDPEERAALVPAVTEFRRNQLKGQPEGPNLLATLGAAAGIGAAALGLGLAGRRFLRGPQKSATAGNKLTDLSAVRRVAEAEFPTSTPKPAIQLQLSDIEGLGQSRLPTFKFPAPPTSKPAIQLQLSDIEGLGQSRLPTFKFPTPAPSKVALTDVQQSTQPLQRNQFINAVESGEDQMTGRLKSQLQRNEDLDLSQVEMLENMADQSYAWGMEQDEPIVRAAASLPDGIPVDQSEGVLSAQTSAARFLQRERDEIASQLGEQGLLITPSRIEQELNNRLGKSASSYGSKYTARRQALELFAKTGDPKLLDNIQRFGLSPVTFETFENMPAAKQAGFEASPPLSTSYYPSEEITPVGLSSNVVIDSPGQGRVSLAELRKPVITEDTALQAESYYQEQRGKKLDWLGNLRVQLEPKRNQILKERRILAEQTANEIAPQLQQAKAAGNFQAAEELEVQLNTLRTIWKNPELGSHRQDELRLLNAQITGAQNKIQEELGTVQKKYPTTISDWSGESPRVYGELDVNTGEFIPETMELRGERRMRTTEAKGGGGRNLAEYVVPERVDEEIRAIQGGGRMRDYDIETGAPVQHWQPATAVIGREIDIYGIRPSSERAADPKRRPSEPVYTKQEITNEAMRMSEADPYGDVPVAPDYEAAIKNLGYQEPTPVRRKSIDVSQDILRIQRTAPPGKAQVLVDQYLTALRNR